jgi:hypothetical protein
VPGCDFGKDLFNAQRAEKSTDIESGKDTQCQNTGNSTVIESIASGIRESERRDQATRKDPHGCRASK